MIKVKVTHLLAPWPAGVYLGAIVAFMCAALPAWALGKCEDAPEGAEPEFAWEPPTPAAQPSPEPVPAALAPPGFEELRAAFEKLASAFADAAATGAKTATAVEELQKQVAAMKPAEAPAPAARR